MAKIAKRAIPMIVEIALYVLNSLEDYTKSSPKNRLISRSAEAKESEP